MKKIYIIAGEASGDNIGAKLMPQLRLLDQNIEFYGIGGPKMQAQGLNLLFPAKEIAFMGFFEILPHIFKLFRKVKQTISHICEVDPDIVITIDSPGFCFRIAKAVKNKIRAKLVHYVAPTVWAYKPERAKKIASIYNNLLVILPFEPEYFLKEGLDTNFVGHPAIEDLVISSKEEFRKKFDIAEDNLLLCLAPGSRKQEIKTLLPIFLEATKLLNNKVVIAIPTQNKKLVEALNIHKLPIILVDEADKQALFSAADFALTKSGTITTELAFYNIPMVVAHKVNWLSYWLLKKMIKVKYVTIINLLANKEIIPELLQDKCNPRAIAEALNNIMNNSYKTKLKEEISKIKIGNELPSALAAKKILSL